MLTTSGEETAGVEYFVDLGLASLVLIAAEVWLMFDFG
jgi:hypothetical protein